jgi:hypothetical protein
MTCSLHEDQYKILIISRSVLFRMRNVTGRICRENQNIHFTCNNLLLFSKTVPWKNIVEPDTWKYNMANDLCMMDT